MIVSVSRRTDIPAFYSDWFINRLYEGYVYIVNPYNKQISKISLNPKNVDCFVFWTKDPKYMIDKLDIIDELGFKYYFQFTLNSYGKDVEPKIRKKSDIIKTFINLSKKIGKERVVWRYDPILLNEYYTKEYHYKWFERLCNELCGYTDKCIISFLDLYEKTKNNTMQLKLKTIFQADMYEIAENFSKIAKQYKITIETCSEDVSLDKFGIVRGKCIDDRLISKILGVSINANKDQYQRKSCGCIASIDIGQYGTCIGGCKYCYANFSQNQVNENIKKYDINSSAFMYKLIGNEHIVEKNMTSVVKSSCNEQIKLDI